ncbi:MULTISPECIES: hypothetical protein [Flavobacteriaceae]|uniref:pirin family protein n=1 Tax=Flavobacteriaceae TaxID=49546 RepID=UPI001491685E|nr:MULTISPECIES: hypothetical protein [Allomuricauda]MDC6366950.1 hypothetical protein [Muricauda sp. AC10]
MSMLNVISEEVILKETAQIFLAGKRHRHETPNYRCLTSQMLAQGGLTSMPRFSDETLAPVKSKTFTMDEDALLMVLPLVGSIVCGIYDGQHSTKIFPEELQVFSLEKGASFSLSNPDKNELANYLQLWIKRDASSKKVRFGNYVHNALNTIFEAADFKIHFGVFDGRMETDYVPFSKQNNITVFVINGAFEVQNRLLESRDSLLLRNFDQLEMEALSENAIIFIVEDDNS